MQVLIGKVFIGLGNWRVINDFAMSSFQERHVKDGLQKDEGQGEGL